MNQKEQIRLMLLCVGLILVFFAMNKAAQPTSWEWLIPPQQAENNEEQQIIRLTVSKNETALQEFSSLLTADEKTTIEDDFVGVKKSESELYQRILKQLHETAPESIKQQIELGLNYQVLMTEPAEWRGNIIQLEGKAKRILPRTTELPEGAPPQFDIWLFTADSGSMPWHIVSNSLPPNCPTGEGIDVPLRVVGTLFKREGYAAEGGLRTTPLILTSLVEQISNRLLVPASNSLQPMLMLTSVVLFCFILFVLWKTFAGKINRPQPRATSQAADEQTPDFSQIELKPNNENSGPINLNEVES